MIPPSYDENEIEELSSQNLFSYLEGFGNNNIKMSYLTEQNKLKLNKGDELYVGFFNVISKDLEKIKDQYEEKIEDKNF